MIWPMNLFGPCFVWEHRCFFLIINPQWTTANWIQRKKQKFLFSVNYDGLPLWFTPSTTQTQQWINGKSFPNLSGWWFGTSIIFSHILGIIIPIDVHIFRRGSNHQPVVVFPEHHLILVNDDVSYVFIATFDDRWENIMLLTLFFRGVETTNHLRSGI